MKYPTDLIQEQKDWLVKASHVHGCALGAVGRRQIALPLLLRAAAMDAKDNKMPDRLVLLEAVILAFSACKPAHADRDEAGRAADELSDAAGEIIGQLQNIAAGHD